MHLNGVRVSRETAGKLDHFAGLFQKWAKSINLIAPSTKDDLWKRHIADSAQIFHLRPSPSVWADLGSGGGFPGVITAILLSELGDGWVDLVESNRKKAAFLRVALLETGARGTVHAERIETVTTSLNAPDFVSARALADLDLLCEMVHPWAIRNERMSCFFHKGRDYKAEIVKARGRWQFDLIEHSSRIETDSVILELAHLQPALPLR